ncbi:MAG: hypothetical protein M5U28_24000 [Sandaracinaceae bacterium]|nr:hypothetical protein [Sandaracinaceae bacterium]
MIDEGDERLSDLGFYVRRVEVPREPLTATAPPGLIPEEMPGCSPSLTTRPTEIEAACARWAACPSPTAPYRQGIDLCVAHVIGASETERATFLASEPCTADPPPPVVGVAIDGCDGDRITGTSASGTVTVADCALLGLTCVRDALTGNPTCGGNGECAVATDNGGGDTYQYGACQGSRLFYRIFGRGTGALRYVDCAELGLGWCGVSRLELAPHEYEFVANCGYEPPEEPVEPGPLVGGVPAGAVELACARAATCATDPNSFQSCLFLQTYGWSMAGDDASDEPHQELLAATTCDDFARALPGLVPPPVRSCSGTGARCVDDAAYGCTSGELVAQGDCEQYGAICSVSGGIASCGAPAGACPEPLTTRTCGSAGGLCTPPGWMSIDGGGALTYEDCMGRGLACMGDGLGGYGCFRPTTECTARESGSRCVGELVVSCEAPGVGRIGARCDRIPGFACARSPLNPADSACVPAVSDCSGTISQCDGDVLRYCLSGSTRALDCATIGATCRSSGGIASCVAE